MILTRLIHKNLCTNIVHIIPPNSTAFTKPPINAHFAHRFVGDSYKTTILLGVTTRAYYPNIWMRF